MPKRFSVALITALGLLAAGRAFTPYASLKLILNELPERVPAELRNTDENAWLAWAQRHDNAIRARLEQGDLDSMVNLLLYGASFTKQPRITMEGEGIVQASKSGVLRARVDDLVAGLRNPRDNERLIFLQQLLRRHGINPEAPDGARQIGIFILQNLQRVVEERKTLANRPAAPIPSPSDPSSLLDRSSLFRDRGLSLDTGIFADFAIDRTLSDLKQRGVLHEGQVARLAVIGPGLDFIDKNEATAYDYYPEQTLQPFALYDSLARLGLAKPNGVSMSIFDISSRVIDHIRRARALAAKGTGYVIQLPSDIAHPWPPDLVTYWKTLGDQVGAGIPPIPPPQIFPGLETRAVRVRPDVVLACQPADLDIVVERLDLPSTDRFDLIVATNIFVYYDTFEQALALDNAGAMLKPGGFLLTNDRLPESPGGSMRLAGVTIVPFDSPGGASARQAVGWYRKQ